MSDYDEHITISIGDGNWSFWDWCKVLGAAALCMTVITLLALLPTLLEVQQ